MKKRNSNYFSKFVALAICSFSSSVFSHGIIESPTSRQAFCGMESKPDEIYRQSMTHEKCRPIMTKEDGSMDNSIYNFMAVLTHTTGRSDKPIAQLPKNVCGFNSENWGSGKTPWDKAIDWPTVLINGGKQEFIWNISWGNHFSDTEEFVYWITKPEFKFDPDKELTWDDFESTPFCKLNYNDQVPNANPNIVPDKNNNKFTTTCNVPKRQNRAVIYAEWGRNKSTYERFHSCIDVEYNTSDNNNDNPPATIKALIKPLPKEIKGSAEIELDGSTSQGSDLSYSWSIDAEQLAGYTLSDNQSAKAHLSLADVNAQQTVTVNLTVKQNDRTDHISMTFTHLPATNATWQSVGKASISPVLNAGDKLQLRLVDNKGVDYYIPAEPIILDEETAKPENALYTLAQAINENNDFSAKIGILSADNKTIEPAKASDDNMIYLPVSTKISKGYINIIQENKPAGSCTVKRKEGSGNYWLGYDIFAEQTPFVLDFSNTGIDVTKIMISPGAFSDIKVLDKNKLLINKKPDWVSKTNPGYIGFDGANHGSYEPFSNPETATCNTSSN